MAWKRGPAADYYVRSLLGTLFIPGIPVAITTLLSFALIRISALWKRREGVTTVMTLCWWPRSWAWK